MLVTTYMFAYLRLYLNSYDNYSKSIRKGRRSYHTPTLTHEYTFYEALTSLRHRPIKPLTKQTPDPHRRKQAAEYRPTRDIITNPAMIPSLNSHDSDLYSSTTAN